MKNTDSVPRQNLEEAEVTPDKQQHEQSVDVKKKNRDRTNKKKKKRNLWPLKALIITLVLAAAVNAASELVLDDSHWWVATILTVVILLVGVIFDMIGTAATACDEGPFLSMASRKVKGGKLAVKLAKKRDVVSSVCCDIVGDICGIVSGVCSASIVADLLIPDGSSGSFWLKVLIYAVISTLTITLKAVGKGIAVKRANGIVYGVAKMLSIFRKEG